MARLEYQPNAVVHQLMWTEPEKGQSIMDRSLAGVLKSYCLQEADVSAARVLGEFSSHHCAYTRREFIIKDEDVSVFLDEEVQVGQNTGPFYSGKQTAR